MKATLTVITLSFLFLCGCSTTEQLAKNMSAKNMIGEGFFSLTRISTANPETGLPEIRTLIVTGKLQSILKDANLFSYTRNRSASVFNAESISEQEELTISLPSGQRMADTLAQLSALIAEKKSISGE